MPFQSPKQRRYMHANLPEIANRWEAKYGLGGIAELNAELNSLPEYYMNSIPAAQGGLIPSHEAGIYGLSEGGRTGFFKGAQADTASGKSMSPGTSASGGTRNGGDGGWSPGVGGTQHIPTPKLDSEPTDDKPIERMGFDESQKFGTGVQDYYKNLLHQKNIKEGKLDFGEQEWQNLIVPGALNLGKNKKSESMGFNELINFGEGLVDQFEGIEGHTADVSQSDIDILGKYAPNQELDLIKMMEKGLNPTITDQEIKDVLQKKITEPTGKFAAQGGIIGLKQGGRIGFFTGMREAEQEAQSTDGGYQNVHQTGAVSQTPGRTATTTGDGYQDRIIELQDRQRKQDLSDIITRGEEENPTEYYGLKDLQNKQQDKKQIIKEKIEGEWQRYMDPSTWQKVQNLYAMTNLKGIVQEIFKGIKRTSDMNAFMQDLKDLGLAGGAPGTNDPLYDQLWLHLEKGKGKYRYDDEGGPEGPQETGIKYENIEEFNEDKMARASTEARQIQEKVDRSKQDAYLAAFRQKYLMGDTEMAAHGGRIPGYNTGGLSNLFRLKNR